MSFSATLVRYSRKHSPSAQRWLTRQFNDPLVKQRVTHPSHFRSRSAFKLIDLDAKFGLFTHRDIRAVVDLGAAPGGWSQVAAAKMGWTIEDVVSSRVIKPKTSNKQSEELNRGFGLADKAKSESYGSWSTPMDDEDQSFSGAYADMGATSQKKGRGTIVAVDLLPMYPIPGVKSIQMDFLSPKADEFINAFLMDDDSNHGDIGKVDVILSDMAANFTGNSTRDVESSLQICEAVFEFTKRHMRKAKEIGRTRGGVLVLKHFQHPYLDQFKKDYLEKGFHAVYFTKPKSSRSESSEGYWVCYGWNGLDE